MLLEIWCLDRTRRTKEREGWAACAIGGVDVCVCVYVLVRWVCEWGGVVWGQEGKRVNYFIPPCWCRRAFPMIQFFDETIFHVSFHVIVRARGRLNIHIKYLPTIFCFACIYCNTVHFGQACQETRTKDVDKEVQAVWNSRWTGLFCRRRDTSFCVVPSRRWGAGGIGISRVP